MAVTALLGNSCQNKKALTGASKLLTCLLGTDWVGGTERAFSQEQLLARPQCSSRGHPPLAGVRNVPEASHPDTAPLCTILGGLVQSRGLGAQREAAVRCG